MSAKLSKNSKTRRKSRQKMKELERFERNPRSGFLSFNSMANDMNENKLSLFSTFLNKRDYAKRHIASFMDPINYLVEAKIQLKDLLLEEPVPDKPYRGERGVMLYRLSGPSRRILSEEFKFWQNGGIDFGDFLEQTRTTYRDDSIKYDFIFTNVNITIWLDDGDDDIRRVEVISKLLEEAEKRS